MTRKYPEADAAEGRPLFNWALAGGASLLGMFAFNRWSTARAEEKYQPIGSFVDVAGARLHYVERGSGTPIVLIHGNGTLIEDFMVSGLFDALASHHRVIAFDRPGYGHSTRPRGIDWTPERQAAAFVEACAILGCDRPLVVGHSWGTLPAVAWALDHPGAVAGLALLSGYYYGSPRLDTITTSIAAAPLVGDLLTETILPLQTRLTGPLGLKMVFSPDAVPENFTSEMPVTLLLRPGQLRATAADSAQIPLAATRLSKRYQELKLPTAIIWGDGDKLIAQQNQSARLAQELPHANAVELPGTGHMVHYSKCSRVAAEIEAVAALAMA